MKVKRAELISHLKKVSCNGQIEEAVFSGHFETTSLAENQLLCVLAPPLPNTEPLPKEVGLANLPLVLKMLEILKGEGNEAEFVDVSVANDDGGFERFVIDEGYRGAIRLMTAHPSAVNTKVGPDGVEKIRGKIPDGAGIPLTASFVSAMADLYKSLSAEEVELHFGKDGGFAQVGNAHAHDFKRSIAEFKCGDREPFVLLLGQQFIDVLNGVTNFSEASMKVTGPRSPIVVHDGLYTYVVSPRTKPSDEKA